MLIRVNDITFHKTAAKRYTSFKKYLFPNLNTTSYKVLNEIQIYSSAHNEN